MARRFCSARLSGACDGRTRGGRTGSGGTGLVSTTVGVMWLDVGIAPVAAVFSNPHLGVDGARIEVRLDVGREAGARLGRPGVLVAQHAEVGTPDPRAVRDPAGSDELVEAGADVFTSRRRGAEVRLRHGSRHRSHRNLTVGTGRQCGRMLAVQLATNRPPRKAMIAAKAILPGRCSDPQSDG